MVTVCDTVIPSDMVILTVIITIIRVTTGNTDIHINPQTIILKGRFVNSFILRSLNYDLLPGVNTDGKNK